MKSTFVIFAVVLVASIVNCQEPVPLTKSGNHGFSKGNTYQRFPSLNSQPRHSDPGPIPTSDSRGHLGNTPVAIDKDKLEKSPKMMKLILRNMKTVSEVQNNLKKERRALNSEKTDIFMHLRELKNRIGNQRVLIDSLLPRIEDLKRKNQQLESRMNGIRSAPQQGPFIINMNDTPPKKNVLANSL